MSSIEKTVSEKQFLDLSRMEEIGITHCKLSSAQDERCTQVELDFDGKLLTLDEARNLIAKHGPEIQRSAFQAKIQF